YCAKVRIAHDTVQPTAHRRWEDAIRARGNIELLPTTTLRAIEGGNVVEGARLVSLADGSERTIACAGGFVYVGLAPSAGFLSDIVARDETGALVVDDALETSLANIFAAGAVRAGYRGTLSDAVRDAEAVVRAVMERLRD